jgi:hypothetical protein
MGDRAVYCARLESVCALTGTGGSNPPPSAISKMSIDLPREIRVMFGIRRIRTLVDWWGAERKG